MLLTKVRICRQEGLGGHGAAHVACTAVQRPNMPGDAILVKKSHYCSVIARMIYSGHQPQTDSSGLMWTGNCVMVSQPNTRPTLMLPRLRHCIPSSTSMEMYKSFDPLVENKNEKCNISGNQVGSSMCALHNKQGLNYQLSTLEHNLVV